MFNLHNIPLKSNMITCSFFVRTFSMLAHECEQGTENMRIPRLDAAQMSRSHT